ncbi:MAG TPA: DNA repair protein RecO [Kofleriaceae bacterium]|jgi:DNA repair protein RecO (recombination protein O)
MDDQPRGVVLKTTPLRESDLVVTLFTDRFGRVSAVARGARKSKIRFAGTLSLLVLGRYQVSKGRGELWNLEGGEIEREWTQLASDVVAVAHASYVAELVGALMPAEAPEPEALDVVTALWDSLSIAGPSPAALRATEFALLELTGNMPAIERCAACGADFSQPEDEEGAVFDASRGGALCARCAGRSRSVGVRMFSGAARTYLTAISRLGAVDHASGLEVARALDTDSRFTVADRAAAREAMLAMVTGLVGKPLRSLEYIAKLGAAARRQSTEGS